MDFDDIDVVFDVILFEMWELMLLYWCVWIEWWRVECEVLFGLKVLMSVLMVMVMSVVIVWVLIVLYVDIRCLECVMVVVEVYECELGLGVKAWFADVGIGMRMRYREYGGDDCVVFVLYDVGECGDVYCGIVKFLSECGYWVYMIDLCGYGETTWSREKRYSSSDLVDDIEFFIIEFDLYVWLLMIVGIGMGGIVVMMVENKNLRLVVLMVLVECSSLVSIDAFVFYLL